MHAASSGSRLQVFMEKYRDAVFGVPAYKPVAGLPNDYDADGGVLRGMAGAIMQFWQHCYGADGSSGVVAAAARAAQTTLHQLCNMPLEGAGEWCEGHFKEQEAIGSAMSVQTFLEQQQVGSQGRAGWAAGACCQQRELLTSVFGGGTVLHLARAAAVGPFLTQFNLHTVANKQHD